MITEGALVSFVRTDQSPLVVQDLEPAPRSAKKRGKKKKGKVKVVGAGLEGFVDLVDLNAMT